MGSETQQTIFDWAVETFGPATINRLATRANVEMAELLIATSKVGEHKDNIAEECADVLICLFRVAELTGNDLLTCVDLKMAINRKRQWAVDETGVGYHKHVHPENPLDVGGSQPDGQP